MTTRVITLTGGLITDTLIDSLYAYAGDTTGAPADEFVSQALDAYGEIIESATSGTWRRSYSEITVPIDTELPDGWQDEIIQQIIDLDLIPIFERATGVAGAD